MLEHQAGGFVAVDRHEAAKFAGTLTHLDIAQSGGQGALAPVAARQPRDIGPGVELEWGDQCPFHLGDHCADVDDSACACHASALTGPNVRIPRLGKGSTPGADTAPRFAGTRVGLQGLERCIAHELLHLPQRPA